jgi:3,4-dihydroxy-9,10-secoandrosta-1,3,5(10)-triene-9,17-dione 4,5-dioxygenase
VGVHSLGYVRIASPQVERWRSFCTDVLGLMPVDGPDDDAAHFRIDAHPPRLVVAPGSSPGLQAIGFEVRDRRELARMAAAVAAAGIEVIDGTSEECASRQVTGLARFTDPGGAPVELFYGPVLDHVPVRTPFGTQFVTAAGGMGHVVYGSPTGRESVDFYVDVLGFLERNTMSTPLGDMWFMSPNERHHTLGILSSESPFQLFHVFFEVASIDDLGLALDRIRADGSAHLMQSLGRHTNDHMISFYVYTPDFSAVELGWGGPSAQRDEPTYAITKGEFWGHEFFMPPAP